MSRIILLLFLSALLAPNLSAAPEKVPGPKAAFLEMQAALADARNARDYARYREIQSRRPAVYLEAYARAGLTATGEDRFYLGEFQAMAGRAGAAMVTFDACLADESIPAALRDRSILGYGRAVLAAVQARELDKDATLAAAKKAEERISAFRGENANRSRGMHELTVARIWEQLDALDLAAEHYLGAAKGYAALTSTCASGALTMLVMSTLDLDEYEALRAKGEKLLAEFTALQTDYVAKLTKEGADARQLARAKSALGRLPSLAKPLSMLGKPAPDWTLVNAFGDVKSLEELRGKVVLLDFWATWCPWCIRSFPALRDLLRDYAGKDFVVVGVTASASRVYEQRFDLDEDMKKKATGTPPPPLVLPRNATEEQRAEHKKKEIEMISKFIANHEMTWPVVMIDEKEPSGKYALTGWPHAVLIDREGRVRSFKRGALLRERVEHVKEFRKKLDRLLSEAPATPR